MTENQSIIDRLKQLIKRKQSKKYYADKLGMTEEQVTELLAELRESNDEVIAAVGDIITKFEENVAAGTAEATVRIEEPVKCLEDFISRGIIDLEKWNVLSYVQNSWTMGDKINYQVKARLGAKTEAQNFQKEFIEFLKTYEPIYQVVTAPSTLRGDVMPPAMLIINKQDEHLNKFDITGDNEITRRFENCYKKTKTILDQSRMGNDVQVITYILGSDQFNSEWTSLTTKGTPQSNIETYQTSFERICDYELRMLGLLQSYCNRVDVIYVPGNHDEYVGWHLINWLKGLHINNPKVTFDTSPRYRKYIKFGTAGIMFNHGDAIKPAKLASMFPIEFKDQWSSCDDYYIFTGDKHHEVSLDFNGIKFYQLPALSKAKSLWDDKNGHTCSKAELTAFVIDAEKGLTSILKQPL